MTCETFGRSIQMPTMPSAAFHQDASHELSLPASGLIKNLRFASALENVLAMVKQKFRIRFGQLFR